MVVQIIGYEIDGAATDERRATLLAEKGTILEDKLSNPEEAQRAFRAALEQWSAEPLALNALERLHLYRKEYEPLYGLYQRALSVAAKPERRLPLLLTSAQLSEDRLDNPDAAIGHYRGILEIDETNAVALEAMRRLTLQTERWDDYVAVLTRAADLSAEPRVAGQHLVAPPGFCKTERMIPSRRCTCFSRPSSERRKSSVSSKRSKFFTPKTVGKTRWSRFFVDRPEVTSELRERAPILAKLGALCEDHLGQFDEAIAAFEEAVELMPTYLPARQALGRLYQRTERWTALAELFRREAEVERDPVAKVTQLFKLAEIRGARLGDADGAIEALQELLVIKPDYPPAWAQLETLYTSKAAWPDLVQLLEDQLAFSGDDDQKVFLLGRIGQVNEEKAGDLDAAIGAYERILEVRPEHVEAIRNLVRLTERQSRFPEMLGYLEAEIGVTEDPATS